MLNGHTQKARSDTNRRHLRQSFSRCVKRAVHSRQAKPHIGRNGMTACLVQWLNDPLLRCVSQSQFPNGINIRMAYRLFRVRLSVLVTIPCFKTDPRYRIQSLCGAPFLNKKKMKRNVMVKYVCTCRTRLVQGSAIF